MAAVAYGGVACGLATTQRHLTGLPRRSGASTVSRKGPWRSRGGKKNQCSARFRVHQPPVAFNLVTRKHGIPVTNALRTLLDLASCVTETRMNQTLDEALRKGLVSMDGLRRFVDREKKSGRGASGVLRRLVEQRDPAYQPSASKLQASVRRLLMDAGLGVVEEYVITDAKGEFIARVDFRLVGEWVVIEVEGRANHSSKVDWEHDLTRRNRITAEGYAVIHATRDKVTDHPEEFLAEGPPGAGESGSAATGPGGGLVGVGGTAVRAPGMAADVESDDSPLAPKGQDGSRSGHEGDFEGAIGYDFGGADAERAKIAMPGVRA